MTKWSESQDFNNVNLLTATEQLLRSQTNYLCGRTAQQKSVWQQKTRNTNRKTLLNFLTPEISENTSEFPDIRNFWNF